MRLVLFRYCLRIRLGLLNMMRECGRDYPKMVWDQGWYYILAWLGMTLAEFSLWARNICKSEWLSKAFGHNIWSPDCPLEEDRHPGIHLHNAAPVALYSTPTLTYSRSNSEWHHQSENHSQSFWLDFWDNISLKHKTMLCQPAATRPAPLSPSAPTLRPSLNKLLLSNKVSLSSH